LPFQEKEVSKISRRKTLELKGDGDATLRLKSQIILAEVPALGSNPVRSLDKARVFRRNKHKRETEKGKRELDG